MLGNGGNKLQFKVSMDNNDGWSCTPSKTLAESSQQDDWHFVALVVNKEGAYAPSDHLTARSSPTNCYFYLSFSKLPSSMLCSSTRNNGFTCTIASCLLAFWRASCKCIDVLFCQVQMYSMTVSKSLTVQTLKALHKHSQTEC